MANGPPKVFISYSHDSEQHAERVLCLANRLRKDGIDAELDQYETSPPEGWPTWCERQLTSADFVLLVCTETYLRRVNGNEDEGIGHGVSWEARIIRELLYNAGSTSHKFVPVLFSDDSLRHVPTPVNSASHFVLKDEKGYECLYRLLTAQPRVVRPSLGKLRSLPAKDRKSGGIAGTYVFRDIDAPWCPEMVALPAGKFWMGSSNADRNASNTEKPYHEVEIERFAIGKYPVTFSEFDHYCEVTRRKRAADAGWGRDRRPVINVSWDDALAYLAWLAREARKPYRLLTEAEWEYACRAGTATSSSSGDKIDNIYANYGRKIAKTTVVGSYSGNLWQIHDMYGNVWEWTQDAWHENYRAAPSDGKAWTSPDQRCRVVRGGSYCSAERFLRCASRARAAHTLRLRNTGFRVAYTI